RMSLDRRGRMMVPRTVAIDDAVRASPAPQLVNLGAGLDGRARRMPELPGGAVFEGDPPDTHRAKRSRLTSPTPAAREVRFVPVDFTGDDLDRALADAGHDPARPTTWILEALVQYLTEVVIEAMLAIIARRSAAGSCLSMLYHQPARILWLYRPL